MEMREVHAELELETERKAHSSRRQSPEPDEVWKPETVHQEVKAEAPGNRFPIGVGWGQGIQMQQIKTYLQWEVPPDVKTEPRLSALTADPYISAEASHDIRLCQGNKSFLEFSSEFRVLASKITDWPDQNVNKKLMVDDKTQKVKKTRNGEVKVVNKDEIYYGLEGKLSGRERKGGKGTSTNTKKRLL
uniref:Uncharacterized protein n=1 Tax=Sphaerodactylus townsendi TaxID=933632 RepID=A0ACB8GCB3_9SAUR